MLSQFLLFCLSKDKQHTVLKLGIFCVIYFPGAHPTQTTPEKKREKKTKKHIEWLRLLHRAA